MKRTDRNMLVGLDIGTTKIAAIVGECNPNGSVEVVGTGIFPSYGMKKGAVVNIESTTQSIRKAIEEAELMAGCDIHSVITGISGSHIRSHHSDGSEPIRDNEVSQEDIQGVIDSARAMALPGDHKILHVLPKEFIVDNQDGVKDPVGMSGIRLEAKVHIVTASVSAEQNILKCITRCGLRVEAVVLQPLASGYAALSDDEKELGVCLIDIGGGTTDVAVFCDENLHHAAVLPIAGDQVTNDIAVALRTPRKFAEEIKQRYACAQAQLLEPADSIEVPGVGERPPRRLERQTLAEVVQPRYEELFQLVRKELQISGLEDSVPAGVVLTGGSSRVQGVVELAEEVFNMPVRRGAPQNVTGLEDIIGNPVYSTGIGLLLYGYQQAQGSYSVVGGSRGVANIWHGVRNWFKGTF